MIDPEDNKQTTIDMLEGRIEKKQNLIKFTEMEIGELKRTVEKLKKE